MPSPTPREEMAAGEGPTTHSLGSPSEPGILPPRAHSTTCPLCYLVCGRWELHGLWGQERVRQQQTGCWAAFSPNLATRCPEASSALCQLQVLQVQQEPTRGPSEQGSGEDYPTPRAPYLLLSSFSQPLGTYLLCSHSELGASGGGKER